MPPKKSTRKSSTRKASTKAPPKKVVPEIVQQPIVEVKRDTEQDDTEDELEAVKLSQEASRAYKERVEAEDARFDKIQRMKEEFWEKQLAAPYWEVPLGKSDELLWMPPNSTGLLEALRYLNKVEKVALIIDNTKAKSVDTYYAYRSVPVLEAKKMFMDEHQGVPRAQVMEEARQKLVQAMKMGCELYIRLANSACDFLNKYTDPDTFPIEVFDYSAIKEVQDVYTQKPGADYQNLADSGHPFANVLRPQDFDTSHFFAAREGFEVRLCTHFEPQDVSDFLKTSIPLGGLQQIKVYANE